VGKISVYIETTVISYLTARPTNDVVMAAHQLLTKRWWDQQRTVFDLCTSELVIDEARQGDPSAAAQRLAVLTDIPLLDVNEAARKLAGDLVQAMQLPPRALVDAAHVAVSAIHAIDFLLTWNCRHLANGALAPKIEQTCLANGFKSPRILTPEMLSETP
jgi:hypothetical protein